MPRRPRIATAGVIYHVLNRRVARLPLFESERDYAGFEEILQQAIERTGIRLLAYCLMPNHWHLVLWPRTDEQLSETMRWLTVTHTQRWHAAHHSSGTGPLYQGRYKSFPVQSDEHFLAVARYVERNALRAKLVRAAENWRWGSLWRYYRAGEDARAILHDWPLARPRQWVVQVNRPEKEAELEALRRSVQRGQPFGQEAWRLRMARRLSLESSLRPIGRPRKIVESDDS
ncbi:MAG: transposase [Betaproteobacteria bacterium]|nr:transposase [Betaproteobacteria bacterium]